MEKIVNRVKSIRGTLRVPSDKSISHRAIILPSLAEGTSYVKNFLRSGDTLTTLNCYRKLGVKIIDSEDSIKIEGVGLEGLKEADDILDMGNSGTTTRLTLGVLSTFNFFSVLTGDDSLRNRPMKRVSDPLTKMGAKIDGRENGNKLPLSIRGGNLKGIEFFNKKSSAQVKSALLLAGLKAEGETVVKEPVKSRDHTEKMLNAMGVNLSITEGEKYEVKITKQNKLNPIEIDVPADPSSAAFFVAAALLVPDSELILKDVLVNPTRDGFLRKVKDMNGNIEYLNIREKAGEPVADILVKYSPNLQGIKIEKKDVPSMIDEIPLLMLLATQIEGETVITGAEELRVKESDRIKAVVENLKNLGVELEELPDGAIIKGKQKIKGGVVDSYNDHRIAMGFSILGLISEESIKVKSTGCVFISYPNFYEDLQKVIV